MTKKENHCLKCNGLMERGFILDHSVVHETFPRWVEGEPSPGSTVGSLVGKKMRRVNRAERCVECGFLEFYTSDELVYG
jgi:hypothetical protein